MSAIEVSCSQCGSGEYRLADERTGEVVCEYCRNRWIVPALIKKSETEKFLEQQSQQPRVIRDNTSETDKQLMGMVSSLAGLATGGLFAGLRRVLKVAAIVVGLALLTIIAITVYRFLT